MNSTIAKQRYWRWLARVTDKEIAEELERIAHDEDAIADAFYRDLKFGTGGLRGVIGAGTNRMNIYTVAKASQGVANYVNAHVAEADQRRIAVSYDSRIQSDLFARVSAEVFVANGIQVYLYEELRLTQCLSFAVRSLGCAAGVMVTASHNPSKYNGYKVYGADGCQITSKAAKEILAEIDKVDIFDGIQEMDFDDRLRNSHIQYISEPVITDFVKAAKK